MTPNRPRFCFMIALMISMALATPFVVSSREDLVNKLSLDKQIILPSPEELLITEQGSPEPEESSGPVASPDAAFESPEPSHWFDFLQFL